MRLGPNDFDRQPPSRPVCSFSLVVFLAPALRIFGDTNIKGTVGTAEDIAEEHDVRLCPSTSLGTKFRGTKLCPSAGPERTR